ncbi:hypothetical protein CEXT_536811, partial [Caerostris extrusa]
SLSIVGVHPLLSSCPTERHVSTWHTRQVFLAKVSGSILTVKDSTSLPTFHRGIRYSTERVQWPTEQENGFPLPVLLSNRTIPSPTKKITEAPNGLG